MKLQNKITTMVMIIIISVVSLATFISVLEINRKIREKVENGLMDMAITLSKSPVLIDNVGELGGELIINPYVNNIREEAGVTFITVTDMNRVRYSHPHIEKVGGQFSNNNIDRAINYGEVYTDEGKGTMGTTVKAFSPIFREDRQVGVVCVGTLKVNIFDEYIQFLKNLLPFIILVALFGWFLAKFVAVSIKKTIFGLEPEEISLLLKEREVTLNNITDGIIAVNKDGTISLINNKAMEILEVKRDIKNMSVDNLDNNIGDTLRKLLDKEESILNLEQTLDNNAKIISNYSLVKDNETTVGAIVSFKNMIDVEELVEELQVIKKLNWDLRAQNHEFMNKLHTILGLIHLEAYDDAKEYILKTSKKRNEVMLVLDNIKDKSISALLLAKYNRAAEAKVDMVIDKESNFENIDNPIGQDKIGCIIGNLLENSIEALKGIKNGKIHFSIIQKDKLKITVKNNGPKIEDEDFEKIFKAGFSTKGENRGLGLFNVINIIENANGKIYVESDEEETVWHVEL